MSTFVNKKYKYKKYQQLSILIYRFVLIIIVW